MDFHVILKGKLKNQMIRLRENTGQTFAAIIRNALIEYFERGPKNEE